MLNRRLILLSFAYLLYATLNAEGIGGYQLIGRIQGLTEGERVRAELVDPTGWYFEKRDSGIVHNGEFKLAGEVPEGPREYIVSFSNHRWGMDIIIDNGELVNIHSNQDLSVFPHSWINDYITVSGSPFYSSFRNLGPAYWLYEMSVMNLKRQALRLVDSIGFDGPKIDQIFQSVQQIDQAFATEFFTTTPHQVDSETTRSFPMWAYTVFVNSHHASFIPAAYQQLPDWYKNSYYGKELKDYTTLCVGEPFPDFTLPTVDGKTLALREVIAKNKITLVHFWGANSFMKKQLQDELKILYKKYHDKGLEIVGFYSDKYADEWKDLVKTEQFPWINVSDCKGKEGMVANVYHEYIAPGQKIPNTTNVLIDSQGKILAWDVYGVELQWYLWRALRQ